MRSLSSRRRLPRPCAGRAIGAPGGVGIELHLRDCVRALALYLRQGTTGELSLRRSLRTPVLTVHFSVSL